MGYCDKYLPNFPITRSDLHLHMAQSIACCMTVALLLSCYILDVSACIIATLYGGACVFIILVTDFITDLSDHALSQCVWMVIVACAICPLTWFGTPKDFWYALMSSIT